MNNLKLWLMVCGCAAGFTAGAVTPADLSRLLSSGEAVTVIDVRPTDFFQKGHVPEAINIPASVIAQKRLPKLGKAIVYDAGLGEDLVTSAVAALNAKPGIAAQALEGGLAAWEAAGGQTTADPGITVSQLPMITYDKLKNVSGNYVIVDLRQAAAPAKAAVGASKPQVDLATEFPGATVSRDPFAVAAPRKAANGTMGGVTPLLVLVDSGDGTAQEIGRALKANGNKRFVILAGGEEIILRKGKPGLERSGSTAVFTEAQVPFLKNANTDR